MADFPLLRPIFHSVLAVNFKVYVAFEIRGKRLTQKKPHGCTALMQAEVITSFGKVPGDPVLRKKGQGKWGKFSRDMALI